MITSSGQCSKLRAQPTLPTQPAEPPGLAVLAKSAEPAAPALPTEPGKPTEPALPALLAPPALSALAAQPAHSIEPSAVRWGGGPPARGRSMLPRGSGLANPGRRLGLWRKSWGTQGRTLGVWQISEGDCIEVNPLREPLKAQSLKKLP